MASSIIIIVSLILCIIPHCAGASLQRRNTPGIGNADGFSCYPSGRLRPLITANATLSYLDLSSVPGLGLGTQGFRGTLFDGFRVWLLPLTANMFVRIDVTTNLVSTLAVPFVGYHSGAFDGHRIWMAPVSAIHFFEWTLSTTT